MGGAVAGGEYNVAIGNNTLDALTSSDGNVAVGYFAGSSVTTGGKNTLIGHQAGQDTVALTTGANNVVIGFNVRTSANDSTNAIAIGHEVSAGSDFFSFGKASNVVSNNFTANASWSRSSDERKKTNIKNSTLGLNFINELRPVTFNWKPNSEFPETFKDYKQENQMTTDITLHGMIAQDVKKALDNANVNDFGGWSENEDGSQELSQEMFVHPLIKAVQELSATVTTLQQEIKILKEGL
jgi:hypothetical protein